MDGKHILGFIVEHHLERFEVPYLEEDRLTFTTWLEKDRHSIDYDMDLDNNVEITEFWWEKDSNGGMGIVDSKVISRDESFKQRIAFGMV